MDSLFCTGELNKRLVSPDCKWTLSYNIPIDSDEGTLKFYVTGQLVDIREKDIFKTPFKCTICKSQFDKKDVIPVNISLSATGFRIQLYCHRCKSDSSSYLKLSHSSTTGRPSITIEATFNDPIARKLRTQGFICHRCDSSSNLRSCYYSIKPSVLQFDLQHKFCI